MFPKADDISILECVKDNDTVAISGFNMATTPEFLINGLYKRYQREGHPKNIFIISDALPAVPGKVLDYVAENLYKDPNQGFLRGIPDAFFNFLLGFKR